MKITVQERVGKCRWCGCTYEHGCAEGCWWANRQGTLCSECVELDRLMRSARGRQQIADAFRDSELLMLSHR
jgi:hypothetical protein